MHGVDYRMTQGDGPLGTALDQVPLGQLIDSIAIPAFVINTDHVITHWNRALIKTSGLAREVMIGTRDHWRPFYGEPRPTMADLIVQGESVDAVERLYREKYKMSTLLEGAYVAEDFFPDVGEGGEWLSFTAAPIYGTGGQVVGAIETLVIITDRKKAEFELAAREKRYRELSIIDDLTGLYNSRHFHAELDRELERARRYKQSLSLCMLDLDHFKSLNDRHGHLFGDQVLEAVGRLIRDHLRTTDTAYRYGGEEFAILMPQADAGEGLLAQERIRSALYLLSFSADRGETITVTASMGIAEICPGDSAKSLILRADQAMYRAKASGRDQMVVWTDDGDALAN